MSFASLTGTCSNIPQNYYEIRESTGFKNVSLAVSTLLPFNNDVLMSHHSPKTIVLEYIGCEGT